MRILRRPALPVVFLFAAAAGRAGQPPAELIEEIGRWKRIRAEGEGAAMDALRRQLAAETARWTARWPGEEMAWRERLRALEAAWASPAELEAALDGAERTLGSTPGLRFPEDTRFLMARAAVRGGVRLDRAPAWLAAAVEAVERELPAGDGALLQAYRSERLSEARWRAAEILADRAYQSQDVAGLREQLAALERESAVPVHDPADRAAAAERARRQAATRLRQARLARLTGNDQAAAGYYQAALAARPATPGEPEPPENAALIAEAVHFAGLEPGPGTSLPPAGLAGPHWLPAEVPTADVDGPWVAVVWDGADMRHARALERLRRDGSVRVVSLAGSPPETIAAVNPLHTAPQIWVADARGVIRLVGRFQPAGDGWEAAVTGAARRLAR